VVAGVLDIPHAPVSLAACLVVIVSVADQSLGMACRLLDAQGALVVGLDRLGQSHCLSVRLPPEQSRLADRLVYILSGAAVLDDLADLCTISFLRFLVMLRGPSGRWTTLAAMAS
jgi:hypothetical protein